MTATNYRLITSNSNFDVDICFTWGLSMAKRNLSAIIHNEFQGNLRKERIIFQYIWHFDCGFV